MKLNRRHTLGLGAAAVSPFVLPRFARSAEFSYTFAHGQAPTHPMTLRLIEAAEKIGQETDGRFEMKVIAAAQLGSDVDMLNQVRSGAIQFFASGSGYFASLVPGAAITGMGFIFPDYDHVWAAMDGDLGMTIRSDFAQKGLHVFDKIWDTGFRQITSSRKAIRTPEDLAGFKVRVPNSPMFVGLFTSLGASPATVNMAETYTALQTGLVDGQENPVAFLRTFRLAEVQEFCSLTSHMWDGMFMTANADAWAAVPEEMQEIIQRNLDEHGVLQREDVAKLEQSDRDWAVEQGVEFIDVDKQLFRQKLIDTGYYQQKKQEFGDALWGSLEKYVSIQI